MATVVSPAWITKEGDFCSNFTRAPETTSNDPIDLLFQEYLSRDLLVHAHGYEIA
jgi:hypothetical protein